MIEFVLQFGLITCKTPISILGFIPFFRNYRPKKLLSKYIIIFLNLNQIKPKARSLLYPQILPFGANK